MKTSWSAGSDAQNKGSPIHVEHTGSIGISSSSTDRGVSEPPPDASEHSEIRGSTSTSDWVSEAHGVKRKRISAKRPAYLQGLVSIAGMHRGKQSHLCGGSSKHKPGQFISTPSVLSEAS